MIRFCSICARGGSKGVKNKNIRDMHGLPLIAHSILQARQSGLFDVISVSSDSDTILDVARTYGVDYAIKRPDALATDTAAKVPVIRHAMETAEALSGKTCDILVDLDATSPLRLISDIKDAITLLETKSASNVFSVTPSRRSPYFNMVELEENNVPVLSKLLSNKIVRRQDSPDCFDINGSIYVWRRDSLIGSDVLYQDKTQVLIMPEERSVDIDSEFDFRIVEILMNPKPNTQK